MFTCVLASPLCCFHSFNYLYPALLEGADSVGRQLRGDKECPFSGVTSSGILCRKVPESDARSVYAGLTEWGLTALSDVGC